MPEATAPSYTLHHGDCLEVMKWLEPSSIDAIVTDPPYALTAASRNGSPRKNNPATPHGRTRLGEARAGFMGKTWDASLPTVEVWSEALRVAKPGAHLLAFGGTRTYHRLACAIEDAGWGIRDCLSWLYGSGFPKSHNGPWGGTALKPGWEPVILARKPLIGTVAANHAANGTGALNIDGCRIGTDAGWEYPNGRGGTAWMARESLATDLDTPKKATAGRWPANVALDEAAAAMLDEQSGERPGFAGGGENGAGFRTEYVNGKSRGDTLPASTYGDSGGASRFFYTAKASRAERDVGGCRNTHPTVKPVDLMRWLVRLVTPIGGTVLDPFTGSGTTGIACAEEGCRFIGIEREAEYVAIAKARIEAAQRQGRLFA